MLLHVPGVLTPEQVRSMRAHLEGAEWIDGRDSVGPQGARVKRNRQLAEDAPATRELGSQITGALLRHPMFVSAALPLRLVPPYFNVYAAAPQGDPVPADRDRPGDGGERYGLHIDGAIRQAPGHPVLRTDVSTTVFLSEPDEYDGGELVVHDAYGVHEVKLPAGDAIVYPATSLHEVLPVRRGRRYASFCWTQSLVADDGRRSMLHDLDRTIQSLREQLGDVREVLALTGHYHNLLRQWAQT